MMAAVNVPVLILGLLVGGFGVAFIVRGRLGRRSRAGHFSSWESPSLSLDCSVLVARTDRQRAAGSPLRAALYARGVRDQAMLDVQRQVQELVAEALSGDVDLAAPAHLPFDLDETDLVTLHVQRELDPGGVEGLSEDWHQLVSALVLRELQRHDVALGRDPSIRVATSDHRRWLAQWLSEIEEPADKGSSD
jgi:hypothetical protein